jgi:LemA protein
LQIVAIAVGAIIIGWSAWTYNSLSAAAQNVDLAWAQVENQLQRRADFIPNLVRVVQAGARQKRDLVALLTQSRQNYLAADTPAERVEAAEQVSAAVNQFQTYVI